MAGLFKTFRAGLSLKEFSAGHPTRDAFGSFWFHMPAGAVDTRGVGDGGGNSAVFACLRTKAYGFIEAPARVFAREDQQWIEQPGHLLTQLLARPNPFMTGAHLGGYIVWTIDIAGDAYLVKVRSAAGLVRELWPLRPDLVEPVPGELLAPDELAQLGTEAGDFIGGYRYTVNGVETLFAPSEIVHLKDVLLDPTDPRHGAAPIPTVLREILSDEEAGQFAASLVSNMGVPGVIVSPKDPNDDGPSEPEAEAMQDQYVDTFGGAGRGRPLFLSGGPVDVKVVSFSPQQLDFKTVRRLPEERISAVTKVPAILAGLGAGLDRSTYANVAEAREIMAEDTLSPAWTTYGGQWTNQLGPDFGLSATQAVRYDTSEVRALQDDVDKAVDRMDTAIGGGWAMVSEGRAVVNLPVDESHEVFLRPTNVIEIGADGEPAVLALGAGVREGAEDGNGEVSDADDLAKRITAATALIRSGFEPQAALTAVGLDPIAHLDLLPVTLQS